MTKRIPAHGEHDQDDARERSMTPSAVHARKRRDADESRESAPRGALAGKESARSGTHRVDPNRKREGDGTVQAAALSAFAPQPAANANAADGGRQPAAAGIETVRVSLTPAHFEAMFEGLVAADDGQSPAVDGSETIRVSLTPAGAQPIVDGLPNFTPVSGKSGSAPGGETVRVSLTPSRVENLLRGSAADGGEHTRAPIRQRPGRVPTLPGAGPSARHDRPTPANDAGPARVPAAAPKRAVRSGHTAAGIGPMPRAQPARAGESVAEQAKGFGAAARTGQTPPKPLGSSPRIAPPPPPLTGSFGSHPGIDFSTSASFGRTAASVGVAVRKLTGRDAWRRFARLAHARVRSWLRLPAPPAARPRSVEEIREYKARMRAALAAHVRANAARAAALARINASNQSLSPTPIPAPRPPRAQLIAPPPTPAAQAYAAAVSGEVRASMRAAGSPGDDPHWLAALAPLIAADAAAQIRAAHGDAGSPSASGEPAADGGDTLEPSELGGRDDDGGNGRGRGAQRGLSWLQAALIALLAAGAADLLVLNLWAVPKALQETSISAARKTQPRAAPAPHSTMPAPRPALAPPALAAPRPARPDAPPERLGFVLFRYGDFWVGPKSHATLMEMAPRMAADGRAVHLIGHADAHGTPSVNRRISEARAHAVARVLIDNGVPEDRIRISGVGSDGLDESALARRVELQLEDMP